MILRSKSQMKKGWNDSQAADQANRHGRGGYIVKGKGRFIRRGTVAEGQGASISPPPRAADGTYNGKEVVGEFHTHPNPPVDENGRQWTREDPKVTGPESRPRSTLGRATSSAGTMSTRSVPMEGTEPGEPRRAAWQMSRLICQAVTFIVLLASCTRVSHRVQALMERT